MERNLQLNLYSGLLIYRTTRNTEFLLFNDTFSNKRHWGPPKGRVIGQEDEKKCALRAAFEIIGLNPKDLRIEEGFKIEVKYLSGTKPKKVSYYLAQHLDAHSRIPPNAEGLHIQWCNVQMAMEKAAFRNMQDVFKHASAFVENKRKTRHQARRKTSESPRSNYGSSAGSLFHAGQADLSTTELNSTDGVGNMRSQLNGLNITSMPDSPRPEDNRHHTEDREFRRNGESGEYHHKGLPAGDQDEKNGKSLSSNPLYKTRLCERFETEGYCPYETKCTFAHGTAELRERSTEQPDDGPSGRSDIGENNLFKTRLCERFMKGNFCQYGPKCNFAHGVAELKNRPPVSKERTRSPELSMDEPSPRFRSPRNGSRDTPQREYHHTTNVHTDVTIPRAHSPAPMVVPSDSDRAMQAKSVTPEPPVIANQTIKPTQTKPDSLSSFDNGNGVTKPKLVQYDRRLPALAKPHTLGHAPWRQGDEKVPLKEALNGQAEAYEKTKIKVVELSKHERDMLPMVKPKVASPVIVQQEENVIRDLKRYFEMSMDAQNSSAADIKEVTRIEMRYDFSKASLFHALFASLLDDHCKDGHSAVSIFKSKEKLFATLVRNTADQQKLLKAWATYVTQRNPQLLPKTSLVLSYWYSCELIEEEVCLKWHQQLEDNSKLKLKSAKFIDWLQTAEEEED